jgi:hypothetical protein
VGAVTDAGAVSVIYGSSSGLSATATPDQFWSQDSPYVNDAPEDDDHFGWSLAAGNFGASSHADLATGIPGQRSGGAVSVIYGSSSGLSATDTWNQFWTQGSPDVEDWAEEGDAFGWPLAAANLGGSSQADLAIGVTYEDVSDIVRDAGAVNVIYGSSSGLSATTTPDQFWTQDSPDVEDAAESGDLFGLAMAAVK